MHRKNLAEVLMATEAKIQQMTINRKGAEPMIIPAIHRRALALINGALSDIFDVDVWVNTAMEDTRTSILSETRVFVVYFAAAAAVAAAEEPREHQLSVVTSLAHSLPRRHVS